MNLKQRILEVGVDKCVFILNMRPLSNILGFKYTSSDSPEFKVVARIDESRYAIEDNYKIELRCDHSEEFGSEKFYISDLNKMIENGSVEFLVLQK